MEKLIILKGKLAQAAGQAGSSLGKSVEILRERVGGTDAKSSDGNSVSGSDTISEADAAVPYGRGIDDARPGRPPAATQTGDEGNGTESGRASTPLERRLLEEWQIYVQIDTAQPESERAMKQLTVVLNAYDAMCGARRGSGGGLRMELSSILGKNNAFCAHLAYLACAEMGKLEWQLEVNGTEGSEDRMSVPHSDISGFPGLLQVLHVLSSVQWNSNDVTAFQHAGLLESLLLALCDRSSSLATTSTPAGEHDRTTQADWEPSELDVAMWILTGRLLQHGTLVRELTDVVRGKEAMTLVFDMFSLDGRTGRQRWSRAQALSCLKRILDHGDSILAMAAYLQAYGCIGKAQQRLEKHLHSRGIGEVVGELGVLVGFVQALAPFDLKFLSDFEDAKGCSLLRRVVTLIESQLIARDAVAGERAQKSSVLPSLQCRFIHAISVTLEHPLQTTAISMTAVEKAAGGERQNAQTSRIC